MTPKIAPPTPAQLAHNPVIVALERLDACEERIAILRRYVAFLEEGHDADTVWDMRRAAGVRPGDVEGPVEV